MAYDMHRIFCATPGDLEPERQAFYTVTGEFNENHAMKRGILFVSLSIIPNVFSMQAYQTAIDENVQLSRFYIQVLGDTWGPPSRNFERYFDMAKECSANPQLPMQEVVVMSKAVPAKLHTEGARSVEFSDIDSYKHQLGELLTSWLESVKP